MQGKFSWYDIMTTDVAAAAAFYAEVVGWDTQDSGAPGNSYTVFTVDNQGVAGLMRIPDDAVREGVQPAWMPYVAVDDVDVAAEELKKQGGTVHRPPETIPAIIRFAVVSDSQGAGFYIAKDLSTTTPPAFASGAPGTIGWHELYAGEWKAAFAFYEKMFGWTKAESFDMGPMGVYQLFAAGAEPIGGIMTKPDGVPHPHWGLYFNVSAIDAAAERVKKAGGSVLMGPQEVPGPMWIIQCTDPQGAYFGLVAPKR
jgi:predicted enzyme related to lactoylglutathione lyase